MPPDVSKDSGDKVVYLGALVDASMWTIPQMLRTAGGHAKKQGYNKALVLFLDDTEDNYRVGFMQTGMRCSEMLSLCDVIKDIIKEEMGY